MEEAKTVETETEDQEEKKQWEDMRGKLNQEYLYDSDWGFVIDILDNRIKKKFLEPLDLLIKDGKNKGSGFSIVAIECLLIEFFAAFRKGAIFNYNYDENCPSFQYKDSQSLYVEFLTTVSPFNSQFASITAQKNGENNMFSATDFYKKVRCGLLHEGKTKDNWTINLKHRSEQPGIFLRKDKDNDKLKIFRSIFYQKLDSYFTNYIKEMKEPQSKDLRRNFARKMDNLYTISRDRKFDWWKDTKPPKSILQWLKIFVRNKLKEIYKFLDSKLDKI